jgi:hypothetical protein
MKGRNLHHVNVQVSDIARSEACYRMQVSSISALILTVR